MRLHLEVDLDDGGRLIELRAFADGKEAAQWRPFVKRTADVGRRRTVNHGLPPRMRKKGNAFYHVKDDVWTALGTDYSKALLTWAHIEAVPPPEEIGTWGAAADRYIKEVLPSKAAKTQKEYRRQIESVRRVFGNTLLRTVTAAQLRQWHSSIMRKVTANRELAVFSTVFTHARKWGLTDSVNPASLVDRHCETGRDVYITDAEYRSLYGAADQFLRDVLVLAYYTGQRIGDVLKMRWTDEDQGLLWVRQAKTKARVRIRLVGPLKQRWEEIKARRVVGVHVLVNERGQHIGYNALNHRYVKLRGGLGLEHIQLRDVRAKTATDLESTPRARELLGHSTEKMTEHYRRKVAGAVVDPVTRDIFGEDQPIGEARG